jgi:copper oxidase (laccase) domain-containing protein
MAGLRIRRKQKHRVTFAVAGAHQFITAAHGGWKGNCTTADRDTTSVSEPAGRTGSLLVIGDSRSD